MNFRRLSCALVVSAFASAGCGDAEQVYPQPVADLASPAAFHLAATASRTFDAGPDAGDPCDPSCGTHARCRELTRHFRGPDGFQFSFTIYTGIYKCVCQEGFDGDGSTCEDRDECTELSPCHPYATCTNTEGSYACECKKTFVGDGKTCTCPEGYAVYDGHCELQGERPPR